MGARGSKHNDVVVNIHSFIPRKLLGKGNFAKVVLVERKSDQKLYALKYSKKIQSRLENKLHHIVEERSVLEEVSHCYIPQLRYSFQDELCLYMVLDYVDGGNLRSHMRTHPWSEEEAKIIIAEVACGLTYLHGIMIVHRDIKPENILLDKSGHAYISDFNVAIRQTPGMPIRSMAGTEPYMAPEILNRVGYHASVDWWSLGVVLFELVYGERPFRSRNRRELIKKGVYTFPFRSPAISDVCQDAISRFLSFDPTYRMGYGEIGQSVLRTHPFLLNISWLAIERKEQSPLYVPAKHNIMLSPPSPTSPVSPSPNGLGVAGQPNGENFDEDIERFMREHVSSNQGSSDNADSNSDEIEEFLYYDHTIHSGRAQQLQNTDGIRNSIRLHSGLADAELPDHINSFHGTTNTSMIHPGSRRHSITSSARGRRPSVASTHAPPSSTGSRDQVAQNTSPSTSKHSEQMSSISRLIKSIGGHRRSKYQSSDLSPSDTNGYTSQTNGTAAVLQSQSQIQTQQSQNQFQQPPNRRFRRVSESAGMPGFFSRYAHDNISAGNSSSHVPRAHQPLNLDFMIQQEAPHEQFRQLHLGMQSDEDSIGLSPMRPVVATYQHNHALAQGASQPQSASAMAASMGLSMRRRHSIAAPILMLRRQEFGPTSAIDMQNQSPSDPDVPHHSDTYKHERANSSSINSIIGKNNSADGFPASSMSASGQLLGLPSGLSRSEKHAMYHIGRTQSPSPLSGNQDSGHAENRLVKSSSLAQPGVEIVYTNASPRPSQNQPNSSSANPLQHLGSASNNSSSGSIHSRSRRPSMGSPHLDVVSEVPVPQSPSARRHSVAGMI